MRARARFVVLIAIYASLGAPLASVLAQDWYVYDTFDDGVIDTSLWRVYGSATEQGGKMVIGTEGIVTAVRDHLIGMSFSAMGYQKSVVGDHVCIGAGTHAPNGDAVTVGEGIEIVPAWKPGDPPEVYQNIFCCCFKDGIYDQEHLVWVPLDEPDWSHAYVFGLEYTPDGSVLVLVDGSVVHSFAVKGGSLGYTQGAEFWFQADRSEPEGGEITAKVDWVKAKAIKPPVASFTFLPNRPMVGGQISFDAGRSTGGIQKYYWDFGDKQSESVKVPKTSHEYKSTGMYTVTLTVTGNGGTDSNSLNLDLTLEPGDILLCREHESLVPFNEWTHVGMYAGNDEVIEAIWSGVVLSPISEWSFTGQGGRNQTYVEALRVETEADTKSRAVAFARSQKDKPFDSWSILFNEKQSTGDKWYCTELVWAAYLNASGGRIDLACPVWDELPNDGLVSPDDIAANHWLEQPPVGEHKEERPETVWSVYDGSLAGTAYCPVDIVVTDPRGFVLSKAQNTIADAVYQESDENGDGDIEDFFFIPQAKPGQYLIQLIAEPNAPSDATYSLEANVDGKLIVLAQDVLVRDMPQEPYTAVVGPKPVAHWTFDEAAGGVASNSAGANPGRVYGAKWANGHIGGALRFDGMDDHVDCGNEAALAPERMTVVFWAYVESKAAFQYPLGKTADLAPSKDYTLVTSSDGKLTFAFGESAFQQVTVRANAALPVGQWMHVAAARDGTTASLYLDGQLAGSAPYSFAVTNKGQMLRIGAIGSPDSVGFFKGVIDDVRIYDKALSAEEIQELYKQVSP